tara:strand:+ start:78 stop:542 length:465 start_codon:yes stop_codon:yes gene_type:complete
MNSFKILLISIVLTFSNCTSKGEDLLGKWTVKEVVCPDDGWVYPPLSALPRCKDNNMIYGSQVSEFGLLFYKAKEKNALLEFKVNNEISTTLFYANYGEKIYEYYPKLDTLKIKFRKPDSNTETIRYDGKFTFKSDHEAVWDLGGGKKFFLIKE